MRKDIHAAAPMPQVMATIYFGANVPGRIEPVTNVEFDRFLRDSVSPRFSGFTIMGATGYWKGQPELVRVFTVMGEDDTAFRTNIRWIAEHYKTDFNQEAVAYSFAPVEYTLNCWPFGPVGAYHIAGKGY